ncbi:MAG: ABC transporter permease, partial [Burkholderiaceae bacterium]
MTLSSVLLQFLTGLSSASALFLVGSGLSLIFGVTRIVNFAHGSFYMLGLYAAVAMVEWLGSSPLGFWGGVLLAALCVALFGALVEMLVLRRLYAAPELYQLLATFALVLVIKDIALALWGAEDLLGPKAPGMKGAIHVLGKPFPSYDVFLIFVGPIVLGAMWLLLTRTRWGLLVRAATQDREMVGALGVNQQWLFTSVFALGTFLAALGGALQMPHEPANLSLDLALIGEAFVVVVVGGMGSVFGAFVAAVLIAFVKVACIAAGSIDIFGTAFPLSKLTLVAEFLVMAVVLIWRPWGLFGKPQGAVRGDAAIEAPLRALPRRWKLIGLAGLLLLSLVPLLQDASPYSVVLMIDLLIAVLFAASLHFVMGPAGMHSFGHAAYFGLGAYGAALLLKAALLPMEAALLLAPLLAAFAALLFGWFCVRLSGVYLAMLTLAFAQIVWSIVFQWDGLTGGSNGMVGIWPSAWLAAKPALYWLTLAFCVAGCTLLARILHAPLGLALRAGRDSSVRALAIGVDVARLQWLAFVIAGSMAGLAGALFAFAKGTISPETLGVAKSVDALVMVLLGGVQTLSGPWVGAALFTW